MREMPRTRRRVSPATLRLLSPLFRFSAARDAYVLRVAGGQYGPALVDRTIAPPPPEDAPVKPAGRFARTGAGGPAETPAEAAVTRTRQR